MKQRKNGRSVISLVVIFTEKKMAENGREVVCVTGAGGYVGSWLVKLLLSKGYIVHGTVRTEPRDERHAHLYKLEKASENLKLFKADLLDYNSLYEAIEGCSGVFHVASPVPASAVPNPEATIVGCNSVFLVASPCLAYDVSNPEVEIIEPAVKGTLNVLKACHDVKVKRVVVVSSTTAVFLNPMWPKGQVKNETCWSDKEYIRDTMNWYRLSKTMAESEAWEYAKSTGLDVVAVCPGLIFGPFLQSTVNASSLLLLNLLKEGLECFKNKLHVIVDVRDVAEALLLTYEKPEANGRYICAVHEIKERDFADKLSNIYPNYVYPKNFTEVEEEKLSSDKLQKLGWSYRSLDETLVDSIENYRGVGLLD